MSTSPAEPTVLRPAIRCRNWSCQTARPGASGVFLAHPRHAGPLPMTSSPPSPEPLGGGTSRGNGALDGAGKPRQDRIAADKDCGNNVTGSGKLGLAVA